MDLVKEAGEYRHRRSTYCRAYTLVWDALSDTSRWSEWMGIREVKVERPSANGLLEPGSVYTVRGLATDRYEVVDYDPPHRMSYRMLDGSLPARDYRAHLTP